MFDFTKEDETERHQRAFDEGVKEGENSGFWGDLFHDLGETTTIVVPKPTEHESRLPSGAAKEDWIVAIPRANKQKKSGFSTSSKRRQLRKRRCFSIS